MPAGRKPSVEVLGLKELARALKVMDDGLLKELKYANKTAAMVVANEAARRAPVRTGKLRATIKGLGQQAGATVKEGSAKIAYAGWIDFGGNIRFKNKVGVLSRPFISQGRIIYPALDAKRTEVFAIFEREVEKVTSKF